MHCCDSWRYFLRVVLSLSLSLSLSLFLSLSEQLNVSGQRCIQGGKCNPHPVFPNARRVLLPWSLVLTLSPQSIFWASFGHHCKYYHLGTVKGLSSKKYNSRFPPACPQRPLLPTKLLIEMVPALAQLRLGLSGKLSHQNFVPTHGRAYRTWFQFQICHHHINIALHYISYKGKLNPSLIQGFLFFRFVGLDLSFS